MPARASAQVSCNWNRGRGSCIIRTEEQGSDDMDKTTFWKSSSKLDSFPRMAPARQRLITSQKSGAELSFSLDDPRIRDRIRPGMKIAVGVGSRGITRLSEIVVSLLANLKQLGAEPFLVPAMGSHGGATAEGQREVMASYGITEEKMGVPIRATMEVVKVGQTPSGLPVHFDAIAAKADGIVVVNRVKLHTEFRGEHESGPLKMLVIGLGKQRGAQIYHHQGFDQFHRLIPEVGQVILQKLPVLCGVATVEDGHHQPVIVEAIPREAILEREKELLKEAKRMFPRIPFPEIDVLIVGEMGKNISGCGMDPNVIGRFYCPPLNLQTHSPQVERISALSLTRETDGNALGLGAADVITRKLYESIDYQKTYANAETGGEVAYVRVPLIAETDQDAITLALQTARRVQAETARVMWIKNTLELENFYVSEGLQESHADGVERLGSYQPMSFDESGTLRFPVTGH